MPPPFPPHPHPQTLGSTGASRRQIPESRRTRADLSSLARFPLRKGRVFSAVSGVMEPRVGNMFRLGRKIGSGSFGEIYLGA
uniref:Protein kinase domain-containing protein n=1 Tax=Setaria italica TaxID=4555 RepID=K3YBA5_SETIT